MRTTSWISFSIVPLFSLFLSQRVSSTVENKSNLSLGSKNYPPEHPPVPANNKEEHNSSGNLNSCLDPQQNEGEEETRLLSAEMDDAARIASKKAGADVITAPASVAGVDDDEEEDSRNNSGEDGHIPERYIVGCGGDRVEAARRWGFVEFEAFFCL